MLPGFVKIDTIFSPRPTGSKRKKAERDITKILSGEHELTKGMPADAIQDYVNIAKMNPASANFDDSQAAILCQKKREEQLETERRQKHAEIKGALQGKARDFKTRYKNSMKQCSLFKQSSLGIEGLSEDAIENNISGVVLYLLDYATKTDVRNNSTSKHIMLLGCIKIKCFRGQVKANRVSGILRDLGMIDSKVDAAGNEINREDRTVNQSLQRQLEEFKALM